VPRPLTARNKTVRSRIIEILRESPLPIATPHLIALVDQPGLHARQVVWSQLRDMESSGLVKRAGKRVVDSQICRTPQTLWVLGDAK
jgi:predicted Zn-ribbon and HTH transcriptional regulator